jgi:hypothetical protein
MKVPKEMNGMSIGRNPNTRIYTYMPRYRKGIYPVRRMKSRMQFNGSERTLDDSLSIENSFTAREINLENSLLTDKSQLKTNIMNRDLPLKYSHAVDYLHLVEPYVPGELISTKNFAEIKKIANHFTGGVTSFFGFESRLSDSKARSDYLFAVSSMNGEREALVNLIKNGKLQESLHKKPEWKQIYNFAESWADPNSVLYDNVLGLWFEFDTTEFSNEMPIPSVFFHPVSINADELDKKTSKWFTRIALPLLNGKKLPSKIEESILSCIKNLPPGAALFQIGAMLSRSSNCVRLVFKRMQPDDIIPYLKSIGYQNDTRELENIINELKKYVTRIVLHIGVGEEIEPKVGIEGSFYPDKYHEETRWGKFLDYLKERGLCHPDKYSGLISYPGIEQNENEYDDDSSFIPSVKTSNGSQIKTLIRYISHIKLTYAPNQKLEAKAYSGVRLFSY